MKSNYQLFKEAVEAVEENNDINNGKWSDWSYGAKILETYNIPYSYHVARLLDTLIKYNNSDLVSDILGDLEEEEYGYRFSRVTK